MDKHGPQKRWLDVGCATGALSSAILTALWKEAGLTDVSTRAIDVFTVFTDFDFSLPIPTEQKIEIRTNPNNTIDEVVGIVFGEISPSYDIFPA